MIIQKNNIKLYDFFGEKFELYFGQFINKNNNYLLDKKNDVIFLSNISNIDNIKKYTKIF